MESLEGSQPLNLHAQLLLLFGRCSFGCLRVVFGLSSGKQSTVPAIRPGTSRWSIAGQEADVFGSNSLLMGHRINWLHGYTAAYPIQGTSILTGCDAHERRLAYRCGIWLQRK